MNQWAHAEDQKVIIYFKTSYETNDTIVLYVFNKYISLPCEFMFFWVTTKVSRAYFRCHECILTHKTQDGIPKIMDYSRSITYYCFPLIYQSNSVPYTEKRGHKKSL